MSESELLECWCELNAHKWPAAMPKPAESEIERESLRIMSEIWNRFGRRAVLAAWWSYERRVKHRKPRIDSVPPVA